MVKLKLQKERKKEGKTRQSLEGNQNRPPIVGIKKIYTQDRRVLCLEGLLRRSTSVVLESQMRLGEKQKRKEKKVYKECVERLILFCGETRE